MKYDNGDTKRKQDQNKTSLNCAQLSTLIINNLESSKCARTNTDWNSEDKIAYCIHNDLFIQYYTDTYVRFKHPPPLFEIIYIQNI
mgnify:CR=1 FL=1